jgi:urease subunit beta
MIPGELLPAEGDIELNAGRETVTIAVANTGDRPFKWDRIFTFLRSTPRCSLSVTKREGCASTFRRVPLCGLSRAMSAK